MAGAFGFVPKDGTREELKHALGEVLAENRRVSPRVPRTSQRTGIDAFHPALARLTPRQQAVFRMLGDGMTEAEIARSLRIAPSTVTLHRHHILKALGLKTRSALVRHAVLLRHSVASGTPSCAAAGPTRTVPHREC